MSNPNIISVSADGLITAGQAGDAVITVINGPGESLIPVHVEVPHVGSTVLGKAGGIVQGANGSLVAVAPDSIAEGTLVSIAPIGEAGLPAPVLMDFQFGAAFHLEVGPDQLTTPAQLAIPIGSNQPTSAGIGPAPSVLPMAKLVLSEDSNVISTLSQLFTLPAGSTHLRFTLLNSTLNINNSTLGPVPPDAFEVALLESGTLTPLARVTAG